MAIKDRWRSSSTIKMGANCRTVVWKPDDHAATQQKHTGDQETISGTVTCGSGFSTNYEIPSPKTTGATFKQVISSTGAQASTSTMGSRDDIFSSGQAAAYPSSMPDGWYLYQ